MKPYIIVCGLGRTGYQVFRLLVQQGFPVTGINETPIRGEVPEVIVGNPRSEAALISAGIQAAQALVLAGNDDSENLAILMQARILNPKIRIINRLFNANLSNRLDQILVDHISMSVSALVGPVFTFAALGKPAIGQLKLFQQTWPIREEVITPQHPWFEKDLAELWADPNRMLIYYLPIQGQLNLVSGVLENRTLASGDRLIIATKPKARTAQETLIQRLVSLGKRLQKFQQHGRSALLVALVLLITIFISALTYVSISLDTSFIDSLYFSVGMITGAGGKEEVAENAPDGIKLFTAIMMLLGAGVIGICYALLNDFVLGTRLSEYLEATRIPHKNHFIICGLGGIGINIAQQLQSQGYPVVLIERDPNSRFISTARSWKIPVILGDASLPETLQTAHVNQAQTLLAVTSNDAVNLEIALSARGLASQLRVVVRGQDPQFAQMEQQIFNFETVLSPTEIAAPAFAASAIGGRILGSGMVGDNLWVAIATLITPNHPFCNQRVQDASRKIDFVPLYVETQRRSRIHAWELLEFQLQSEDVLYLTLPAHRLEQLWQPIIHAQPVASATGYNVSQIS